MNYSTYISAAEKLKSYGQTEKASVLVKHANDVEENTHRINSTIKSDGTLVWSDGNLFNNRRSANNFSRLLNHLKNYQKDVRKVLKEMSLEGKEINLLTRTYYK